MKTFDVTLVPCLGGRLSIGHRPRLRAMNELVRQGVTHVVTLLAEHEGAPDIGRAVERSGLSWEWLPLANAKAPPQEQMPEIEAAFSRMKGHLERGASLYIHCSAGIHRTGMIAYGFLRFAGVGKSEAMELLGTMRPVTGDGVGEQRLEWGDNHFARPR